MENKNWQFGDLLEEGLEKLNLDKTDGCKYKRSSILTLLRKYIEEIELFNEAYGLVKVIDRRELIVKHILDSLAPLGMIFKSLPDFNNRQTSGQFSGNAGSVDSTGIVPKSLEIADAGSGAGLPGIPLAICLPETEFTLIERMGRRAGFLRNCIAVLGISNIRVEEKEMEKAIPGRFDLAVFRAFRPLEPVILKGLFRLLKPGGFLAAWKGRIESSREEMLKAEKSFPGLKWEIQPVTVPFLEEERCLTFILPGS